MGDRVFGIRGELTKPPHSPSRAAPCPAPRRRDGLAREPVQTARPCGPPGARHAAKDRPGAHFWGVILLLCVATWRGLCPPREISIFPDVCDLTA